MSKRLNANEVLLATLEEMAKRFLTKTSDPKEVLKLLGGSYADQKTVTWQGGFEEYILTGANGRIAIVMGSDARVYEMEQP